MRNAVFLVKNGIGFGHIRRALLIAEAVQDAGRLRPIIISQASSLALYRNTSVRVVNFPLLHRVPSAITEDFYTDLMSRLLDRLNPAVIIEDTYPDARYRRLGALADRPRILVMRRLDGLSFDQIRERGDLAHYDRILIAQNRDDFRLEGHSGESLATVASSGRFAFVGNIAGTAPVADITAVRREYAPETPLIVVIGRAWSRSSATPSTDHRARIALSRHEPPWTRSSARSTSRPTVEARHASVRRPSCSRCCRPTIAIRNRWVSSCPTD